MAEGYQSSNFYWHKASTALGALQSANNAIMVIGKANNPNTIPIALTMIIPKETLENNKRYYIVTAQYSNGERWYLQIALSKTATSDIGIYMGDTIPSSATYDFYFN